jgi:hypothetical protein
VKAIQRIKSRMMAPAFDTWRHIADWLAFEEKFWGTAVERAAKRAYMRWAGKRWHEKTVARRALRRIMAAVFKKSEVGMLMHGFSKLRTKPSLKKRGEWKPRKLGFCTCVYQLTHGGHCTCSFELHFHKRMQNFGNVMQSSDDIFGEQLRKSQTFEKQ